MFTPSKRGDSKHMDWKITLLSLIIGSLIQTVLGMVLPRPGTVKLGMTLYKMFEMALGQKRATRLGIPAGTWSRLLMVIRTTFTDLSFGIYIASREDLSIEDRKKKVDEYLTMHLKVQDKNG